jgi:hypothetical protein
VLCNVVPVGGTLLFGGPACGGPPRGT